MLEQAASALNRRDYKTAAQLIAVLIVERPDDYQVQLYAAQLHEATEQLDKAVEIYRSLLQHAVDPRIIAEARQGIHRIEQLQAARRPPVPNRRRRGNHRQNHTRCEDGVRKASRQFARQLQCICICAAPGQRGPHRLQREGIAAQTEGVSRVASRLRTLADDRVSDSIVRAVLTGLFDEIGLVHR